jgi:CO/xanthine dehydrogenase FAD-binding subunit
MSRVNALRPASVAALLDLRAEHPEALLVAGGTDVMVPVNFGRLRPELILDMTEVSELRRVQPRGQDSWWLGCRTTFSDIERQLRALMPGLAVAARTVGSPQIRNLATIGGNIATGSPAGDSLPVLLAMGASIDVGSTRGTRTVAVGEFFLGPGRTVLGPDECILGVHVPVSPGALQQFAKIGARNAMVISVASFALHIDPSAARVGTGMGSVGPTPLAAPEAERFLAEALFHDPETPIGRVALSEEQVRHFGELVSAASRPIDDVRGTAAYRRHVIATMSRRTLSRLIEQRRGDL